MNVDKRLIFSGALLPFLLLTQTVQSNSIFPWLALSMILFVSFTMYFIHTSYAISRDTTLILLSLIIAISVITKAFILVFPPGLIGADPDTYLKFSHLTAISGNATQFDYFKFYNNAPIFHILLAETELILGESLKIPMLLFPFAIGILTPLTAYILSQYMFGSNKISLFAVLFASVLPIITVRAFWPIPQSLGFVYFLIMIICLYNSIRGGGRHRLKFIVFLMILVSVFTHKIIPSIMLMTILSIWMYHLYIGVNRGAVTTPLTVLSLVMVLYQFTILTDYLTKSIGLVGNMLSGVSISEVGSIGSDLDGASPATEPFFSIFHSHSHALLLLPMAALSWLFLFKIESRTEETSYTLVLVSVLTGVFAVSSVNSLNPSSIQPMRIYMLANIFYVLILSGSIYTILTTTNTSQSKIIHTLKSGLPLFVLILLLVTQIASAAAYPAYPGEPRMYLNSEEMSAKEFGYKYVNSHINTNGILSSKISNINRINSATHPSVTPSWVEESKFQPYNLDLINKKPRNISGEYILYTDVSIYKNPSGSPVVLTWEPADEFNRNHNRVYNTGATYLYKSKKTA